MNKFTTKFAVACASALPALCSFAEGESGSGTSNMGAVSTQIAGDIKTGFEGLATSLATPIGAIIIAGLGLWLIFTVVKLFKRAWNRSA